MSKRVKQVTFIILLFVLILAMVVGIKIGNFNITSISKMKEKNSELENKIETASKLTSVDYPEATKKLEDSYEKYTIQKEKYEELVQFATEDEKGIYETKQYDISYLWKTVGKYATAYNLTINMDVKKTSGDNLYDLYFTVSGTYVNTSEFIAAIENDSDLFFRIYDFKMTGSSETVATSFTVKDININPSTLTGMTNNNQNG